MVENHTNGKRRKGATMYTQTLLVFTAAFVMTSSAQTGPTATMEIGMTSVVFENGTTIETTTANMPPTTQPGPTPCAAAYWIIRDSNRAVCMLMSFSGNITYSGYNYDIANKTSRHGSVCDEQTATFSLFFRGAGGIFHIVLNFSSEGKQYELSKVMVEFYTSYGLLIDFSSSAMSFFTVPTGKHYTCEDFEVNLGIFDLALSSPVLQPFVLETKDQCGLGEACTCGNGDGSSTKSKIWLIVGCGVAGLVVVVVVVTAGGYMIYRRNKRNEYSRI